MPDESTPTEPLHTEDLAVTEYDAGHRARAAKRGVPAAADTLPTNDEAPEVGLSQKSNGEGAIEKPRTDV